MKARTRTNYTTTTLIVLATVIGLLVSSSIAAAPAGRRSCGGLAGIPCPGKLVCVDDPSDNCDPKTGGRDCSGICVAPRVQTVTETTLAAESVLESSTDECAIEASVTLEQTMTAERRGCKQCKRDRRWCACTHNGMPRASCDPCCYTNDSGLLVCLD